MCYSATASFGVGSALIPAGVYCVRESIKKGRSYLGFAAVPLMFGIQQISEGFVWLGLNSGNAILATYSSLFFLFFALAVWPFWIALSSWAVENRQRLKNRFKILCVIGMAFGAFLYVPILLNPEQWLVTSIAGHSIRYDFLTSAPFDAIPRTVWQWIYVGFIVAPLFLSQNQRLRILGLLITLSAVFSNAIFWNEYISVWCMFAAMLSIYITWIIKNVPANQKSAITRT